jgi:cytochrome c oxidase subunit 2
MIPGKTNRILFDAEKPGVYRGQCEEFCGAQHAHMSLKVFAESPSRFRAWLHNMSSSAPTPTTAEERSGEHAFMADQCAS